MTISGAIALAAKAWKVIRAILTAKKIRQFVRCKRGHHEWEETVRATGPNIERIWFKCKHCGAEKEETQRWDD